MYLIQRSRGDIHDAPDTADWHARFHAGGSRGASIGWAESSTQVGLFDE
jgi:hypothetical protein